MSYLFGDSAMAQSRLDILARTFQGPTREFLANFEPSAHGPCPRLGLWAGPHYPSHRRPPTLSIKSSDWTNLLTSYLPPRGRLRLGFPSSTTMSLLYRFPIPSADLIFCRFLLPHLPNPMQALVSWASQLSNESALLVEEVDWIHTDNPVLDSYLTTLARVLDAQGTALCAGAQLTNLLDGAPLTNRLGRHLPPSQCLTATLLPCFP